MNDMDDGQLKAEIDQIMKGVKNIMQKIDAIAPEKQEQPEDDQDSAPNPNRSDPDTTGIK